MESRRTPVSVKDRVTRRRWVVAPVRRPGGVRAGLGVLVAAWVAFTVASLVRTAGVHSVLWDEWVYDGLTLGSAGVVLARAALVGAEASAWGYVGAGMACSAVGDIVYSVWVSGRDPEPVPSIADGFYLGFYPLVYVGLVLLLRARLRRFPASAWLDGLVAAGALTAASAAVVFAPIAAATSGPTPAVVVGLAYPLGDLLLLAVVAGALALMGWRTDPRWWLLSAGLVTFAVADTIYLLRSAAGSYVEGTWLDALCPAASLIVAATSWSPTRRMATGDLSGWAALIPPLACTATSLAVLDIAASRPVPRLAVVLATLTLIGAAGRFALGYRDAAALTDSRRLALTDELTGLANRRALLTALADAARRSSTASAPDALGMLLIDLDRFKEINDSLGHQVGDELLRQLADRLRRVTRPADLLARLGGDEFAVLLTGDHDRAAPLDLASAQQAAGHIATALAEPFALDDVTLHVTASVGIALLPDHTRDPRQLLQRADVAMYTAKTSSTRTGVYRPQDDPHSRERLQTLEQLRAAITTGELICHYQPKVTLDTGAVHGVEALVRWQHPTRGLLGPEHFITLAEHAGLMRDLTTRVLDTALAQVHAWRTQGHDIGVAVNLSATNLLDVDLPEQIGRMLATRQLPPTCLQLEITESVLMRDSTRSRYILSQLRALGVETAIDDYGTGYSSLAYLQELAVNELKLDQCFIARLTSDPRAAAIVRSTIELAHSLGLRLVAEGVEDHDTLTALIAGGCDISQGYHHSRPLPPDQLTTWLTTHNSRSQPRRIPDPRTRPGPGLFTR